MYAKGRFTGATEWSPVRSREKAPRTVHGRISASQLWDLGVRKWMPDLSQEVLTRHAHKLKPKKNRLE